MFKYIASGAALVLGGAFLGYSYAMNSVEEHLKKQDEYNKDILKGLRNVIFELQKPEPVIVKKVDQDPGKKKGVLDIFDKD